jgi:filamentous hemagglutinin
MKRFPQKNKSLIQSQFRRFSVAHVILVHALVVLTGLAPTPIMADMLSINVGHAVGGGGATPAATPSANPVNTAAATAQAHAHALDMLSRNTMALDAVNAMQHAAQLAAAGANNLGANPNFAGQTLPNVPNGLGTGTGGLDINGLPVGANAPTQSVQNAHTIVTIQQTQQQALLNWNTFNVGKDTTVKFDQSAGGADVGTWIAFNKISDPSGNPTQILGSIQAQGQVYIINQNGIIFGGGSQVDTHAMVASALPLNDNLVTRGLLNNPDAQFLFSADAQPSGSNGPTPIFTPPSVPAFGKIGNVTVQAGAHITAPTSSANVGGRIVLIGPNVTNNGTLSTPDGQTILAAGMQVGFNAHSSNDPSLRGLDVYVGDVGSYGGTATNAGLIEAPRGSVLVTGKNVNQDGFINSSTSVALNGRIDLLANYNAIPNTNYSASNPSLGAPFVYPSGNSTGLVNVSSNSVTQILPQWSSTDTVVGTELALKSQINFQGLSVYFGQNSVVLAPNANIAISAGIWDLLLNTGNTDQEFVSSTGQVYLDQGAVIDVSGSTAVQSDISKYILTVVLRGAELADSALQRNGNLRGQTITVDLRQQGVRSDGTSWVGTPLANLSGYLGIIQRTVGELTVAGGNVSITAGDSVVQQNGSAVNVSGGYVDFAGGNVATTRLVSSGNLVDIAKADPNVAYSGVYTGSTTTTDASWGVTTTTTGALGSSSHYEPGYSNGANGGSLQIASASMVLDGSLFGGIITDAQQLQAAPQPSNLSLKFQAQQDSRSPQTLPFYSPTPPSVVFSSASVSQSSVGAFPINSGSTFATLPQARRDNVYLKSALLSPQGFGSLTVVNYDGSISVPADVTLTAAATGSIVFNAANIDIEGALTAPGGSLQLISNNVSPYTVALLAVTGSSAVVPPADPTRGKVTIGSMASLSTAGLVLNDRTDSAAPYTAPHAVASVNTDGTIKYVSTTQGGNIQIQSFAAELATGSILNVSGGLSAANNIVYGNAGKISIQAGNDPLIASLTGGHLTLGSSLMGISGATGGTLTLQAPTIQVGGTATYANTLLLDPGFFSAGGFSQFNLIGLGTDLAPPAAVSFAPGIILTSGALIEPIVSTLQASVGQQNGYSTILLSNLTQPEGYRNTAALNFEANGIIDYVSGQMAVRGSLLMQAGAKIVTDALGRVNLQGQIVEMLGQITAPGGNVVVKGASIYPSNSIANEAYTTVHLGSTSSISTAGKTVLLNSPFNYRVGNVYAGGTIQIAGNIVADTGALLDVSGTTAILDLQTSQAGQDQSTQTSASQLVTAANVVPTKVDSNGGTITLQGNQFLFSNATLLGNAGGATAQGGSLSVQSAEFIAPGGSSDDKDITLEVAQNMTAFAQPIFAPGQITGQPLVSSSGTIRGLGYFGVNTFQQGGFDSLKLAGNIQFLGAVNITARASLSVATGGVLTADSLVQLTAPYVTLGRPLLLPTRDEELLDPYSSSSPGSGILPSHFSPTSGTGRLDVFANLIETGFLSLQNIGQASLTAMQEVRGNSYFDVGGDLTITAGQVYPVTASTFTISSYGGTITFASTGVTPAFPLSGGGRLNVYAANINQNGVLRAPLGSIRLGWDGTGTAPVGLVTNLTVPVTQQITLLSGSVTSVSAINPVTGAGVFIPYGIVKDGTNWIDPTGLDITSIGVPDKTILLSAKSLTTQANSSLDARGGGELYGYRWVEGNGGTKDTLATTGSYAIIPGFSSFSPYAPFATAGLNVANLGGDLGYTNSTLHLGDQIYLKGNALAAAGSYTLLPARYALLPGALLITPSSGTPVDSLVKPGGAVLTNGYLFNDLNSAVSGTVYKQFEVAPSGVVRARSQYSDYMADSFIPAAQQGLSQAVTRTSLDAGYALFSAVQNMQLAGDVSAAGYLTGRGGRVDISSPLEIVINSSGTPQSNKLVLKSSLLAGWNAESLLIGGQRVFGTASTAVAVRTNNLTLDAALTGKEIILAANQALTLTSHSSITQQGTQTAADTFVVTGNGALVRVSGTASALTSRTSVTTSSIPSLTVAAGVPISGTSITLDSTNATSLANSAVLTGQAINLNSGRISLLLNNYTGSPQPSSGLVLAGTALSSLQNTAALSLLSYSSLDLYGSGTFSNSGTLALHAAEIRGFNSTGSSLVNLSAQSILLDNSAGGTAGTPTALSGVTTLNITSAGPLSIGKNVLLVDQYSNVNLNAPMGIVMQGTGSFTAQGNLAAVTPFFSSTSNASQGFIAGGTLSLTKPSGSNPQPGSLGLGSQISFEGSSVTANTDIRLPSGLISIRANTGDINIGGLLDAGGTAQTFFDQIRYTDAGNISLTSSVGNVNLNTGGIVTLAAAAAAGNAGSLYVSAPMGQLVLNGGSLLGQGGMGGNGGSANIDVGSLTSFNALNDKLNGGLFSTSRSLRVRSGNVLIDGTVTAHSFTLGVDQGAITVNGVIDASGATGGMIDLAANASTTLGTLSTKGSGSGNVITLADATGITLGQAVSGLNIASGTFITGISGKQITLSQAVTATVPTNTALTIGARLTVAGATFDNAGKGGSVTLESGTQRNGFIGSSIVSGSTNTNSVNPTDLVTIATGTMIDLSVASKVAGGVTVVGSSAFQGEFSGTLHIRAPQINTTNNSQSGSINDMLVSPINGTILGSSSIEIEGYRLYSFNQSNVIIQAGTNVISGAAITTATLQSNATAFLGAAGTTTANYSGMFGRLLTNNAGLSSIVVLAPGIEISNLGGSISLGTTTSAAVNDWDLSATSSLFRFGTNSAPGVLTLRASGNLEFYNTLSDGFTVAGGTTPIVERMWMATLSTLSQTLPVNTQSWTYRMSAGADFSSANFRDVVPLVTKAGSGSSNIVTVNNATGLVIGQAVTGTNIPSGTVVKAISGNQITLSQNVTSAIPSNTSITFGSSLLLGKDAGQAVPSSISSNTSPGPNALTRLAINPSNNTATTGTPTASNRFQVIRTGTGDISINTAADVELLNQFATIYSAGAQVASSTTVFTTGDFVLPILSPSSTTAPNQAGLGAVQQLYPAQYSMAGGNVSVSAGRDIVHYTRDSSGNLIMDSERELPNNWLMRRGYVDPITGQYGTITNIDTILRKVTDSAATTSWWINFSNFFDGIAALGGGNVTLHAGRDVQNVDAHVPTNARAAKGTPSAAGLLELGGGDLTIQAGRNIDGGVYYVERGMGTLSAGANITTNATRAPGLGSLAGGGGQIDILTQSKYQDTWLPTTLFVGKSSFKVSARGDILLGPVANTLLLPQGVNNKQWYKSYFSTYAEGSGVSVLSLGGNVTFRQEATLPGTGDSTSMLVLWMNNELLLSSNSAAYYQPWLRLIETNVAPFNDLTLLMPGTLRVTAFSGDINLVGSMTLSPSPTGTLELMASGAVNGLQPTGVSNTIISGSQTTVWGSSTINLSDTSPNSLPGFLSPFSYYTVVGSNNTNARQTSATFLQFLDAKLTESGSTTGNFASTQAKQALHAQGLLHATDYSPVLVYANGGDISGLTLFSGKSAQILAQRDISDIGLYLQNVRNTDVSLVSSGRDIVAYNASSILRSAAVASGNLTAASETPKSGDIQISGPGTLQVLAGRNLNLGTGSTNSDGTGVGITSIGNGRNPYLPFSGANLIAGAGMGASSVGIGGSTADFADFITYISTTTAGARYLVELANLLGVPSVNLNDPTLTANQQKQLAMAVFYLALRDAGRDHNDPTSPYAGTYTQGFTAIAKLFPATTQAGSIQTLSRNIRTKSGGDISILSPDGGLQLASTIIGSTLAPPGIITEAGGNINIFANNSIDIGIARIFTLRGGDITIWSSTGDIAAGSSSKTVQSAPPTRVLIDPQSANVSTDLAGLATGGGIGVLATVAGVRPGNVDLIAPIGAVDAGDAGIRATGNLNIAATIVLNAANISVGGSSSGTPAAASVSAPSLGGVSAAGSSAGAATTATTSQAPTQGQQQQALSQTQPSLITVEVLGYGGGDGTNDNRKKNSDQPGE